MRCPICRNWLARIVGTHRLLCVDGCQAVWLDGRLWRMPFRPPIDRGTMAEAGPGGILLARNPTATPGPATI